MLLLYSNSGGQTISIANLPVAIYNSQTLVDMSTATTLIGPGVDDSATALIPIGFTFGFLGQNYDSISISTNGFFRLGSAATAEPINVNTSTANIPRVAPYWDDVKTATLGGGVKVMVWGTAPRRNLTVQWVLNVPKASNNVATIQATITEGNGAIQFDYGYIYPNALTGYSIGLYGMLGSSYRTVQIQNFSNVLYNNSANQVATAAIIAGSRIVFKPDSVPAVTPAQLQAYPYSGCIDVTWRDSSLNELFYGVERSTDGLNFTFLKQVVSFTDTSMGTVYSIHDSLLISNQQYYYRVSTHTLTDETDSVISTFTTLPQLSGVVTIPIDYPTIETALEDIYCKRLAGDLAIELDASYNPSVEVYPVLITPDFEYTPDQHKLTIRPAANVSDTIKFTTINNYAIELRGGRYITIDGRPGGVGTNKLMQFFVSNFQAGAIGFTKSASNNVIKYCTINQAGNGSAAVLFNAVSADSAGCSNNILADNTITGRYYGIRCVAAAPNINYNNQIINNYFLNCPERGLMLEDGNDNWLIEGNSFYQTGPLSYNSTISGIRDIEIVDTRKGNHRILRNFFGGTQPGALGGLRQVASSSYGVYQVLYATIPRFSKIYFEGNVFRNTYTGLGGLGSGGVNACIVLNEGTYSIGSLQGNMFGDSINSVSLAGEANSMIMTAGGLGNVTIQNNIFSGIDLYRGGNLLYLNGLGRAEVRICNNRIGTDGLVNSITGNTSSSMINVGYARGNVFIENNLITTIIGKVGMGYLRGIDLQTSATNNTYISNNIIRNLVSQSTLVSYGTGFTPLSAIHAFCNNQRNVISNNSIYNLKQLSAIANIIVHGIHAYLSSGDNIISNNKVHNIVGFSNQNNYSDGITGIALKGAVQVYNNSIQVGVDSVGNNAANTAPYCGIRVYDGRATILHNSIYVGVDQMSSYNYGVFCHAGPVVCNNNIIVNNRDTANAVYVVAGVAYSATGNLYKYNSNGESIATVYTDPLFTNPDGASGFTDLSLLAGSAAEGKSIYDPNVYQDINGHIRGIGGRVTPGAYELNPVSEVDTSGPEISFTAYSDTFYLSNTMTRTARVEDFSGVSTYGYYTPRIYYKKNSVGTFVSKSGDFVSGNTNVSYWNFTVDSSIVGGFTLNDTVYYFIAAQDLSANQNISSTSSGFTGNDILHPTGYPDSVRFFVLKGYVDTVPPVIDYVPIPDMPPFTNYYPHIHISDVTGIDYNSREPEITYKKGYNGNKTALTGARVSGTEHDEIRRFWIWSNLLGGMHVGDTIYYYFRAYDVYNRIASNPPGAVDSINGNEAPPPIWNYFVIINPDTVKPVVSYVPLLDTLYSGKRDITAHITDNVGVFLNNGIVAPRVYFKKSSIGVVSFTDGNLISGTTMSSYWNFIIPNSNLLNPVLGDTVFYFIAAADAYTNLASNPVGITGTTPANIQSYPPLWNSYIIRSSNLSLMCPDTTVVTVGSSVLCNGDSSILIAPAGYAYSWSTGVTSQNIIVSQQGAYVVTITDNVTCSSVLTPVLITLLPHLGHTDSVFICEGDQYVFNNQSLYLGGVYYDTLTAISGCDSVVQLVLTVNNLPVVLFNTIDSICFSSTPISLNAIPAGGHFTGSGVVDSSFNPTLAITGPNVVTYVYSDVNGCAGFANDTIVVSLCADTNCHALYTLYPDPIVQHNWFALNQAQGVAPINYLWSWGDGNNSVGATPSHSYTTAGYYNICLSITDSIGCIDSYCDSSNYIYKNNEEVITINCVYEIPSGIESVVDSKGLFIYPNPADDLLYIESNGIEIRDVKIYTINGTLVSTSQFSQSGIAVSSLATGVYIAEIDTKEGVVKKRWVKI